LHSSILRHSVWKFKALNIHIEVQKDYYLYFVEHIVQVEVSWKNNEALNKRLVEPYVRNRARYLAVLCIERILQ